MSVLDVPGLPVARSRYINSAARAATSRLLSKLKRGVENVTMLTVGDSTGNEQTEHVYLEFAYLAAQFPAYTFVYYPPGTDDAGSYATPVTVQTGTGSLTCTLYNSSYAGQSTAYLLGSRWTNAVAAVPEPDIIWISHGHNLGDPSTDLWLMGIRAGYLALTEELTQLFPKASLICEAQNPTTLTGRETWQAIKAQMIQRITLQRGYGYLDIHQAFVDTNNLANLLLDGVHPNPTGTALWASVVQAALTYTGDAVPAPTQPPSALTQAATGLIPNQTFATWTASTNPDGWAANNATLAKDVTNYETGSWGLQITAGGTSGIASADFTATTASLGITGKVSGRVITVAARVFVPAGYTGTPSLLVLDQAGSSGQFRNDIAATIRGRYCWVIVTKRMTAPTTSLTIRLCARLTGTDAGSITVDRVNVVEGDLPREAIAPPVSASGTASAALAKGQQNYLSTFGSHPGAGLAAGGSWTQAAANVAVACKVRPFRDMTIALLEWFVATQSGNYDIGILDSSGNRLWSKGSTAVPAAGAVTETVSPAVALSADVDYYVTLAVDNTTVSVRGSLAANADFARLLDGSYAFRSIGSAFPIPTSLALGSSGSSRFPLIVLREA